jgi:hypothetical protein
MKCLILGLPRGWHRFECLSKALKNNNHTVDIITENFDDIVGPYDRIFTISESLLPIQSKLEKKWGLKNLSETAADVLSDKKKFDDLCVSVGLENLIPHNIIPTSSDDLDYWIDKPFIVKPVIGSGSKSGGLNYISFKNKKDFLLYCSSNKISDFFTNNKTGWVDKQFNNRINFYMVQDQLSNNSEIWGPYYYVNNDGDIKDLLWVKGKVWYKQIDKYSFETKLSEWISFDEKDVPNDIRLNAYHFYNRMINKLELRNMFFSGPDFYKFNNRINMIDCNPRIGQGLQMMDDIHDNTIVSKILNDNPYSIRKKMLWKVSKLKPGKIKSVKDTSHLSKYFCKTNTDNLRPGETIEEYTHICSQNTVRISFLITGTNESDMYQTYQTVNTKLQNCIEYF